MENRNIDGFVRTLILLKSTSLMSEDMKILKNRAKQWHGAFLFPDATLLKATN